MVVGVLEKIFALNERVRLNIQRYLADLSTPNTLTPYAMARYMDAQNESRSGGENAMHCTIMSSFAATIRYASENTHTATVYTVNLNEMTCSCFNWQQTGIPCKHACYFMTTLGMSTKDIFTTGYFLPICFTENWNKFYSHNTMIGYVPGDGDIEQALANNTCSDLVAKFTAPSDDLTRITKKRLRGSEEKSTKGSLPPSHMKGRHICLKCGKSISNSTKHPWKACDNFRNQKKKRFDSESAARSETTPTSKMADGDSNNFTHVFSPRSPIASFAIDADDSDDMFSNEL